MNFQDIAREISIEGFRQITVHPGFVVGKRRRSPRSIVFNASDGTVALYVSVKFLPTAKSEPARVFEVVCIPESDDRAIVAVRSPISGPDDLAFLSPKLETILAAVRILWESESP